MIQFISGSFGFVGSSDLPGTFERCGLWRKGSSALGSHQRSWCSCTNTSGEQSTGGKKTGPYLVGNLFCMLYFAKATFIYGFQKIRPNSMFWHLNYQVSLKAQNGETPLHLASRHGHVSLAQILLEHGAAANETSLEGKQTVVAGTESDVLTCLPRQWMTIAYYGRTVWGSESWLYCYVCYIMFCYSTCLIILI